MRNLLFLSILLSISTTGFSEELTLSSDLHRSDSRSRLVLVENFSSLIAENPNMLSSTGIPFCYIDKKIESFPEGTTLNFKEKSATEVPLKLEKQTDVEMIHTIEKIQNNISHLAGTSDAINTNSATTAELREYIETHLDTLFGYSGSIIDSDIPTYPLSIYTFKVKDNLKRPMTVACKYRSNKDPMHVFSLLKENGPFVKQ